MRIRKATLEKLESMGIKVSPFPTKEAEEGCFEAEVKNFKGCLTFMRLQFPQGVEIYPEVLQFMFH